MGEFFFVAKISIYFLLFFFFLGGGVLDFVMFFWGIG